MALFAHEGSEGGGVASSFGIRELVWRPGSVVAPIVAGVVWARFGIEWVFFIGGGAALSGVLTFAGILYATHGTDALSSW